MRMRLLLPRRMFPVSSSRCAWAMPLATWRPMKDSAAAASSPVAGAGGSPAQPVPSNPVRAKAMAMFFAAFILASPGCRSAFVTPAAQADGEHQHRDAGDRADPGRGLEQVGVDP